MPIKKAALVKIETQIAKKERADAEREARLKAELAQKIALEKELEKKKQKDAESDLVVTLSHRCIEFAGDGCFFYPLNTPLADGVIRHLRVRGFEVSTVDGALAALKSGLHQYWKLPTESALGLRSILEPLRKFLAVHILETLKDSRITKTIAENLADVVFDDYCKTAGSGAVRHLRRNLDRLLKIDKDELCTELIVRDLIVAKENFFQVRQQLGIEIINSRFTDQRRDELIELVRSALSNLEKDENVADSVKDLIEWSDSLGRRLRGQLMVLNGSDLVIHWWSAFAAPPYGRHNYAISLFWLASPAGQAYFQDVSQAIEFNAKLGRSSFSKELELKSEEWCMSWIISMYLGHCGYRVNRKGRFNETIQLVVSW